MNLSHGQVYFLNTFGYIKMNEWRLKAIHPPAVNGEIVWQYQKGIKHINSFAEQINPKHDLEQQNTSWLAHIEPPEIEIKRGCIEYMKVTYNINGIRILCPTCNHVNEHGVSEGHRSCDRLGACPGYILKII